MRVKALTQADRDEVVAVLADAFAGYPVMRYVLGARESDSLTGLHAILGFYADKRLHNGWPVWGVVGDGTLAAVALISPADCSATPITARLEAEVKARIGVVAHERMLAFEAASDANEPEGAFHFVGMLGARKAFQGRGYGRTLLDVAKQSAIEDGMDGIALSTEDPNNLSFYERLGFVRTGHAHLEGTPPLDTWGLKWSTNIKSDPT